MHLAAIYTCTLYIHTYNLYVYISKYIAQDRHNHAHIHIHIHVCTYIRLYVSAGGTGSTRFGELMSPYSCDIINVHERTPPEFDRDIGARDVRFAYIFGDPFNAAMSVMRRGWGFASLHCVNIGCRCVYVCMCVCVRARACECVCVCVCARMRAWSLRCLS